MPNQTVSIYEFEATDISNNVVLLDQFEGKVCIVVNSNAQDPMSKKVLGVLHKTKLLFGKGVDVLVFPCFQFGATETLENFMRFIEENQFHDFHIFNESQVNGPKAMDLYKFLKKKLPGQNGGFISNNLTMFVMDKKGHPKERLKPNVHPYVLEEIIENFL